MVAVAPLAHQEAGAAMEELVEMRVGEAVMVWVMARMAVAAAAMAAARAAARRGTRVANGATSVMIPPPPTSYEDLMATVAAVAAAAVAAMVGSMARGVQMAAETVPRGVLEAAGGKVPRAHEHLRAAVMAGRAGAAVWTALAVRALAEQPIMVGLGQMLVRRTR